MRLITLVNLPVILLWLIVGVAAVSIDWNAEENPTEMRLSLGFSLRLVLTFCPSGR